MPGLQVLALERGAFRDTVPDFATTRIQDELRYAVRNELFEEPERETLTFRNSPTRPHCRCGISARSSPASGAGGAGVHWNGQNWRFLPTRLPAALAHRTTLRQEDSSPPT